MFSCQFCEISDNTIFKVFPQKNAIVDVWPGSRYASVSSQEKV